MPGSVALLSEVKRARDRAGIAVISHLDFRQSRNHAQLNNYTSEYGTVFAISSIK
jgi:hypothetical protein